MAARKLQFQEMGIRHIRVDHGLQSRVATDMEVVKNYSDAVVAGAVFPPVVVFFDGKVYWLADGFHRIEGHKRAGKTSINAEVKQGDRRDAIIYSVGANLTMGVHPTKEDREKGAMMLLSDEQYFNYTDTEISRRSGLSRTAVTKLRKAYCESNGKKIPEVLISINRGRETPYRPNRPALREAQKSRHPIPSPISPPTLQRDPRPEVPASALYVGTVPSNPKLAAARIAGLFRGSALQEFAEEVSRIASAASQHQQKCK
jgi:hypothetical protein